MITCPRCGFQAPDGSPWCPRCGYGCPYPVPYQQQPVYYQPQQIPAQYDVVDVPPQPEPAPVSSKKRTKKKKKKLPKWLKILLIILGIPLLLFIAVVVYATIETIKNPPVIPTRTSTATITASPTFTPIPPTKTPRPTITPRPTNTPEPTNTPLPTGWSLYTVREGENCWSIAQDHGISEQELLQANGMTNCYIGIGDQILIPSTAAPVASAIDTQSYVQSNTNIRGSIAQDTTGNNCNIKGNINADGEKIYHCKNSSSYDSTEINTWAGERWFCSPEEAEAAGWRAPKNMTWCQQ